MRLPWQHSPVPVKDIASNARSRLRHAVAAAETPGSRGPAPAITQAGRRALGRDRPHRTRRGDIAPKPTTSPPSPTAPWASTSAQRQSHAQHSGSPPPRCTARRPSAAEQPAQAAGVCGESALAPGGYLTMLEITDNSMRPPHRLPLDHVPSDRRARRPKDCYARAPRRAIACSADDQPRLGTARRFRTAQEQARGRRPTALAQRTNLES
jgi:hypothetical protein